MEWRRGGAAESSGGKSISNATAPTTIIHSLSIIFPGGGVLENIHSDGNVWVPFCSPLCFLNASVSPAFSLTV